MTTPEVRLTLPMPPSVNALYANAKRFDAFRPVKGRVKTEVYRGWLTEAGWQLKQQRPGFINGPYELHLVFPPSRHDLGNLEKAVSDLLQRHGVVSNDSLCQHMTLGRDPTLEGVSVLVRPASACSVRPAI